LQWLAIHHPNPSYRIEAINSLNILVNQQLFYNIVNTDPIIDVRITAFYKIESHELLFKIAEEHRVFYARRAAIDRLPDYKYKERYKDLLKKEQVGEIRAQLVHKISFENDQNYLIELLNSDPSDYVAETVTNYIEDQEILFKIVVKGRTRYQKIIALSKIYNKESLIQLRLLATGDIQQNILGKIKQIKN
jgi:hypothetical protein